MPEGNQEAGERLKIGVFVFIGVWPEFIACASSIKLDEQNIAFMDFYSKIFIQKPTEISLSQQHCTPALPL